MTVKNLEIEEAKEKRREVERKKLAEERKKYTLSMIEKDAKKDFEMERDENALLGKSNELNARDPQTGPWSTGRGSLLSMPSWIKTSNPSWFHSLNSF